MSNRQTFAVVIIGICVFAIAPGAHADECDAEIKRAETSYNNESGMIAPQRLATVERLINKAKTLRDEGKNKGCIKVSKRAQELIENG